MDRDEVLARVGGDEDLLRELVPLSLDDCPALMAEIRKAVVDGDAPYRAARSCA